MNERKIPPQSIESEMAILGAVFCDNDCIKKVSGMIDASDFYRENHRKIFRMMLSHQIQKLPVDLVTSCNTLKEAGELEEVGGGAYLAALGDYVPTSANVHHYCKIVKEMSVRRQMIAFSQRLETMAYDDEVGEIIPEAKTGLAEIVENMDSFGGVSLSDLSTFDSRLTHYQNHVKTLDKTRFVTGFYLLDQKIRGVAPGEKLTIIAEPGGFKTALLQNILMRGAKRTGRYALFFSMEMPQEKVFEREVQITSDCSGWDVENHFKGQIHISIDENALRQNGSSGLIVCAKTKLSVEKMERYIELTRQKFGEISAVGVDYLQLMPGPGKIFDRVEFNAPELKNMAKRMQVPVIDLSQINVSGRKEKFDIQFEDAKGGGAIQESADIGLGFYTDKEGKLVCKGLKNRNGAPGWKFEVDINRRAFQFIEFHPYVESTIKKKEEECPYE